MSNFSVFKNKLKNYLPVHAGRSVPMLSRHASYGLFAFIILAILFSSLIYQRYLIIKEEQKKEAYIMANNAKDKLQEALASGLSATKILSFFIDNNGTIKNFDSVAAQIFSTNKNIDALELVPDGVIQYVYPLKGNESVIGYNILIDTARNKEAFKAIQKNELFFSGPFKLKQGGFGIVGRLPVFRNGEFWGFSAVVIKIATLLKATGIDRTGTDGYYYQLSKINPDTKKQEFFIPHVKEPLSDYHFSVDIPEGDWKLSVEGVDDSKIGEEIIILSLLGLLFSGLGGLFVFIIVKRPEKLDRLVRERTKELKTSETKYRSLIERVSDAFVSLDKDWNFTYLNQKAGEIFTRKPEKLLGKNIWTEFPAGVDKPFYHAYFRAMETQQFQYLEDYYPLYDKWFENHIYPSKDGLTVFYKDITEVKKISLALKENEEKYRSLIEQASDGIVITDLDGYILEVNKSIALMSGYTEEEMPGKHLYSFLPEEDASLNPLRFKELMEGKSLLYERRLLRKDGTVLDIEVNSKMASSQTLIGFIRDITERRKNEDILRYQARLLEAVSDAITSLDMNRCIVSWNQASEDMYGFTAEEAMGKRIPELVTFEFPGTTPAEVFNQVFSEGKWKGEFNFIHPKTKIKKHLLSSISLLKNMEGDLNGFIITSKDISDRKRTADKLEKREAQLLASIENTPNVAVQWYNDKGEVLYWNHASELMYGWTSGEAAGKTLDQLIHTPGETEGFLKALEQVARTGSTIGPSEYEFRRRNGTKGFCSATIFSIPSDEEELCFVCMDVDITENKKAAEELIEKEKKLKHVLSSTVDNFYVVDPDYIVVLINNVAERNLEIAWGKPVKPGTNLLDVIPVNGEEPIKENFEKAFAGERIEYEMHLSNPGLPSWVMIYFSPVVDETGTIIGVSVVAKDISERKKAEVLIQESEERYRALVENATEALVVLDVKKQVFVNVSESATKLFRMSREELLKVGPVRVSPEYQPDGRSSAEAAIENIQRTIDGEKLSFEWMHCDKDGNPIPCEVWLVRLPSENEVLIRGTIIDITERKKTEEKIYQSEQKYRLLFYNNPLPMWMTNIPEMDVIDVNESAIKHYGYTREEFLKLNATDMRPAEDVEYFLKEVKKMKPGTNNPQAWRHKKKNGSIIHVEVYSHEILYEGKRVWLGLANDVTEKYLAKELLQKSYEDIRRLASNLQSIREDERTNIAREIHDELGQQLTGLKMDLHWLARKINSVDADVISKMKESIELINATISSVRKIATDLRPSILDDLGLLAALEWQSEEFEKRSGTEVKFINRAEDIIVQPEVATAIFRIYQELLTNIARHANAKLVTAVLHKDDNLLYFSITDDGSGFDPETINNKKTLGLLGIKERTLLLGGNYEFKSKPGKGSETVISIPLAQARIKL